MYNNEKIYAEEIIDRNIADHNLSGYCKIFLFGAGQYSRAIIDLLSARNLRVCYILDNNSDKSHTFCKGVEIVIPEEVSGISDEDVRIIICSKNWREMQSQLTSLGVPDKNIIVISLRTYGESLRDNISDFIRGRSIYRGLVKRYPGYHILFCPYSGTGDIYLIGSFLEAYLEKEKIDKYVLVVVSSACKRVASLFSLKDIEVIGGMDSSRALTKYYMACPDDCNMTIMNDSWEYIYTNPIEALRGLHGMNFVDMFRTFVFALDSDVMPRHPKFRDKNAEVKKIAEKYGLIKGKSILLAPHAGTLAELAFDFWEKISKRLQNEGYIVCTNLGGDEETEIFGTVGIRFPLDIAPHLVDWMGGFIGTRSGLCDVISGTLAKKVILYDKANLFFNTSAFKYFSLKGMHLSEDAVEIQFDNRCPEEILDEIIKVFEVQ